MLAAVADAPELKMTPERAAEIREATEELARLYPVGISEKKVAWVNFSFAVGGYVGPAVLAIWNRPVAPRPQVVPRPIRPEGASQQAPQEIVPVGLPAVGPVKVEVPSDLWNQPGDTHDDDGNPIQ